MYHNESMIPIYKFISVGGLKLAGGRARAPPGIHVMLLGGVEVFPFGSRRLGSTKPEKEELESSREELKKKKEGEELKKKKENEKMKKKKEEEWSFFFSFSSSSSSYISSKKENEKMKKKKEEEWSFFFSFSFSSSFSSSSSSYISSVDRYTGVSFQAAMRRGHFLMA